MTRLLVQFWLLAAISAPAWPAHDGGTNQVLTWAGEFVNSQAETQRELVVTAWYPKREQDGRWPLILLAPGRGVMSIDYARVAEFLAEHGFVVVGIDSPGSGRQHFSDGRIVPPDPALAPPPGLMAGPYIEVDRFFAAAAKAGAQDLVFVLDRLSAAEADKDMPFAGRIDVERVGLLGHSLGGRIAGAFAEMDSRAVAWIGIEGLAPRTARRQGLRIPALAILGDGVWPYAIGNVRELAWCAQKPTYFVKMAGIEHNTITDGDTTTKARVMPPGQLRLAETILGFFEHHMAEPNTPLQHWPDGMTVERYDAPSGDGPPGHNCSG